MAEIAWNSMDNKSSKNSNSTNSNNNSTQQSTATISNATATNSTQQELRKRNPTTTTTSTTTTTTTTSSGDNNTSSNNDNSSKPLHLANTLTISRNMWNRLHLKQLLFCVSVFLLFLLLAIADNWNQVMRDQTNWILLLLLFYYSDIGGSIVNNLFLYCDIIIRFKDGIWHLHWEYTLRCLLTWVWLHLVSFYQRQKSIEWGIPNERTTT